MTPRETLSGTVQRVTFHNPENGFAVLLVKRDERSAPIRLVGYAHAVVDGEALEATGEWIEDKTYGRQFRADELRLKPPVTTDGLKRFLGSGLIKGIGKSTADKLVNAFGESVFDVIENFPAKMRAAAGLGKKRADKIRSSWNEQRTTRDAMAFLLSHGIGTARAVTVVKRYGPKTIAVVQQNPYQLVRDIRGIGFQTADEIAGKLGIDKQAPQRLEAGVHHVMQESIAEGHCGLPREELLKRSERILESPRELIEQALLHEIATARLISEKLGEESAIFLPPLFLAEEVIAARLHDLLREPPPWRMIDRRRVIAAAEKSLHLELAASQRVAVELALSSKVMVITGGPGVGKTTIINSILTILKREKLEVALCAPTGRAAKRLGESTGLAAKTIHRLLEADPKTGLCGRNESDPLKADLVVVDEASMVDVTLMQALLRAIRDEAALLVVGDVDQLPPVGPGNFLSDLITSELVPVVRLTEIFRQAKESRIISSAHAINRGVLPDLGKSEAPTDFYFAPAKDAAEALRKLVQIVTERIPERFGLDPVRDTQVLAPMNRGICGVESLNNELQRVLNGGRELKVAKGIYEFSIGDKVMQTENDYTREVYNGDIGIIEAIDDDEEEMQIDFDGRVVDYTYGDLDKVVLAYATTIHKSQGSEYPAVVIPMVGEHSLMHRRNLLYTAVTRGKRLVVLVGARGSIESAVKNFRSRHRWSKLKERLVSLER